MNPFEKYLGPEDNLHIACCQYLRLQHPKVLFTHPANEGKRTKFEQYKIKRMGMKSGVPDLLIFEKGCPEMTEYVGLAIELKIRPNKPTANQTDFMRDLEINGWFTSVCYSLDEFINLCKWYF